MAEKLGRPVISSVQLDIIEHFVNAKDVFICISTGGGKSLTYMAAPFVLDWAKNGIFTEEAESIVIVVSPLIVIMEEQETFLLLKGLKAVYIGGDNVDLEALSRGEYNYVSARSRVHTGTAKEAVYKPCLQGQNWRGFH